MIEKDLGVMDRQKTFIAGIRQWQWQQMKNNNSNKDEFGYRSSSQS